MPIPQQETFQVPYKLIQPDLELPFPLQQQLYGKTYT